MSAERWLGRLNFIEEPIVESLWNHAPEAAWRQALSMDMHKACGLRSPGLVIIGGHAPSAIGAGVVITLTTRQGKDGKESARTPSMSGRRARDRGASGCYSGRARECGRGRCPIFDSAKKAAESGEALRLRYAAQTATLTSIAQASAQGLELLGWHRHLCLLIGGACLVLEDSTW